MNIKVISRTEANGMHVITFKYWKRNECACLAVRKTVELDYNPTKSDLIGLI